VTLYIVKHAEEDYRLHKEDGSEIDAYAERPTKSDIIASLSNGYMLITEGYNYRDLTIDAETVPWQT